MELKGRWVQFAIRDIYFPTPESVLLDIHGDDVLAGQILDVSDDGATKTAFVVVKVDQLKEPVVVPVERIRD